MCMLPDGALVHGYVLNNLEDGLARVVDLIRRGKAEFGFSHLEILAAAEHFGVVTQIHKDKMYWMSPANLFGIWWGLRRDANFSPDAASQR